MISSTSHGGHKSYAWLNGQMLPQYGDGTTCLAHRDRLGSARVVTSVDGYPVWQATYLPFGQEWNSQITVNHYKFTRSTRPRGLARSGRAHSTRPVGEARSLRLDSGRACLERDSESNLDHTWFRQFSSGYGRWLTPDPLGGDITNPQSVNRYSYVGNNPPNLIDALGLEDDNCTWDPKTNTLTCPEPTTGTGPPGWDPDQSVPGGPNCPRGWHLEAGLYGQRCVSGDRLGEFVKATKERDSDPDKQKPQPLAGDRTLRALGQLFPIAASVVVPLFGGIAGPAFSFAFIPQTQQFCVGGGLGAVIPASKVASAGPLAFGNLGNAPGILRGTSVSVNAQVDRGRGVQYVWSPLNPSGSLLGPSAATSPGASVAVTYSWCTSPN